MLTTLINTVIMIMIFKFMILTEMIRLIILIMMITITRKIITIRINPNYI